MTETAPTPLIDLADVGRVYRTRHVETHALSGVRLTVEAGEFVAVTGPSGCGKSTLLSILGLLDLPTSGNYRLLGTPTRDMSPADRARIRNRHIGFVFQAFNLIGELTVQENVELPLIYRGLPPRERRERAREALNQVGLTDRTRHFPAELSGGGQQRVAVARAVVGEPALLLADEPTGNLDSAHALDIMDRLTALNRRGTTILLVTHNPEYAGRAGRVVPLRDGRVAGEDRNAQSN